MKAWKDLKSRLASELREKIWDSEQVLKVRQKFSELDTQTQSYIVIGSFSAFVLVLLLTFFVLWGKTISLKNEIARMDESIRMAQNSEVRIEELRAQQANRGSDRLLSGFDGSGPADSFAERVSTRSLIAKAAAEVSSAKGGAELKLNKISLRQLTRVLFLMEKSGSGASIDKLSVETRDDPEGYLWARVSFRKESGAAKGGF